ncbi:efflux RND transporter periplasmic adaptor subunit [Pedobacter sandarakinus]|uniref:efflux RND transporter periplasmic adaptor subunit n=1 Tax=Pedobacter sandarakinus TaxID=353156 RepID=UPI0022454C5C|nr:efflux RND transporter periplasmic adaptor subunit [Pedobacter sandarakinus]MCX2574634.1 efflux RND transporter periplasmic adaptor subunit [Pedobacter sandarakinus]
MKNISSIIILLFLFSCKQKTTPPENQEEINIAPDLVELTSAQLRNAKLEVGKLEDRNVSSIVSVNGNIDVPPQNMVSISMPLGGYLKSTKLLPGMHVNKGEAIAVMEDQQYIQMQQDFLTIKAKLEFAQREYVRQKELNQSQASSNKVFQQAEAEYKTLRISLGALTEKLSLININAAKLNERNISRKINLYSPITGFVSKVNVNIGKYVNPADVLFEMVNPTDIHLNLRVFEKDLPQLAIGQKLKAYSNNAPNKKYDCEIILISKDLTEDHLAEVHCHFENYDKTLIPGLYMNAEIAVNNNTLATLPEEAFVDFEGKQYVFVALASNKFKMVTVETGTGELGRLALKNPGDLKDKSIVTKGAYTLLMKLKNKAED